MRSVVVFASVSIGILCATASPCFAGEEESKTLFAQARQLREAGKCGEAIVFFRKSLETFPEGLGALRNAAECEEEVGRLASARRTWRDLEVAVTRAAQARYDGWDRHAVEAQARLAKRVPKVKIVLVGEGQVLLNGRPFDPRLIGVEIEQDLGPLEVVLEDDAAVPQKQHLDLKEGQVYVVNLKSRARTKPGGGTGAPPGGSSDETSEGDGPSGMFIGGIVSLSLGGLALGGMGAALGIRQSAISDLEDICPGYEDSETCRASAGSEDAAQDAVDRAGASSIAVNVLAAVGGAGVATGAILLIVDATSGSGDAPKKAGALRFGAVPTPEGAYFTLGGRF